MTHFNEGNTEGFTAKQLSILNEARDILMSQNDDFAGMEGYSLDDMITNVWAGQATAEKLADDVHRRWMAS